MKPLVLIEFEAVPERREVCLVFHDYEVPLSNSEDEGSGGERWNKLVGVLGSLGVVLKTEDTHSYSDEDGQEYLRVDCLLCNVVV